MRGFPSGLRGSLRKGLNSRLRASRLKASSAGATMPESAGGSSTEAPTGSSLPVSILPEERMTLMPPRSIGEESRKAGLSFAVRLASTLPHWLGVTKRQSEGSPRPCASSAVAPGRETASSGSAWPSALRAREDRRTPETANILSTPRRSMPPLLRLPGQAVAPREQDSTQTRKQDQGGSCLGLLSLCLGARRGKHHAAALGPVIVGGKGGD